MAQILKFKKRVTGSAGAPSGLKTGEPAVNMVGDVVYIGYGDDGNGNATSVVAIGGKGAFVDKASAQTIAGVKTFDASPIVPTPLSSDNSQKAASTAYVKAQGYTTVATRLDQFAAPNASVAMNGNQLKGLADPTGAQDAVTKAYVDGLASGVTPHNSVTCATTTALSGSPVYNNGASGFGATLTRGSNGALGAIDGYAPVQDDRILVNNQADPTQNGIYTVTDVGGAGAPYILTRADDANTSAEINNCFVFVANGTQWAGCGFVFPHSATVYFGTTNIAFTQFSGAGEIVEGTGITKSGNTISINTSWPGQAAITTVGTITTGTWNGTPINLTTYASGLLGMARGGAGVDLTALADGALLKKTSSGLAAATADTDYLTPNGTLDGGTY